ncbi:MAG: efflux transporter outer membrane subunit [Pseudomonadota bacterium]
MKRPVVPAVLSAIALSGCGTIASFTSDDARNTSIETSELAFALPAEWQADLSHGDLVIAQGWSSSFGTDVEALVNEALASNLDLQASVESVAQAEALLAQSRAALSPFLSLGIGFSESEPLEEAQGPGFNFANPSAIDTYSANLSVAWEADLRGVNRAGVRAGEAQLAASQAILEASRQNVAALTAVSYFELIAARRQLALAERTETAIAESSDLVDRLFEAGAVARRDQALSRSDLASAKEAVVAAEIAVRQAQRALEVLLGRYPGAEIEAADTLPAAPGLLDPATPLDVLRRRPDIVAAEFNVIAGTAAADQARARRWPQLTFSGGLSSGATEIADVFDPVSMAATVGGQLAQSLFDGGLRGAQIDAADASVREGLARYGSTVLSALADVENTSDLFSNLRERESLLKTVLTESNEALRLTEVRYQAGDTDLLDVLNLRQRSFAAERALIANRAAQLQTQVRLYQALGGPVSGN